MSLGEPMGDDVRIHADALIADLECRHLAIVTQPQPYVVCVRVASDIPEQLARDAVQRGVVGMTIWIVDGAVDRYLGSFRKGLRERLNRYGQARLVEHRRMQLAGDVAQIA